LCPSDQSEATPAPACAGSASSSPSHAQRDNEQLNVRFVMGYLDLAKWAAGAIGWRCSASQTTGKSRLHEKKA
jgi:hypothetical protein